MPSLQQLGNNNNYEIMAPAGNWECLSAALNAGADSVYFGIGKLNMRSHSSANFQTSDLKEIVSRCAGKGVKTYLALNTVMYDNDLSEMRQAIDAAKEAGVSAIIASDVAVMQYARSKGVEVHLSTQLNISNVEALKFYAQFADVAVLARELDLDSVKHICKAIDDENILGTSGKPMRIEMFCHGALCMATSGKCYLSLHDFNRSANRGECMQLCRRSYTLTDNETGTQIEVDNKYLLSPKDLKTIHFLNKMVDAGVKVFKIEGRARGPEYVATTVSCYKEALQACLDGSFSEEKIADWDNRLSKVFNRGFWDGYYLGRHLGEWSHKYGSQATERKQYAGKVTNYFKKIGVAECLLQTGEIAIGDKILFTGETTGAEYFMVEELHDNDGKPVNQVSKGTLFAVKVDKPVRRNDKLYKIIAYDGKGQENR